ncbi:MAG: hypothetical protein CMM59_10360 [Rhodospirillaceae bacterium]|nr:hypothetical protein [Rhodospirillaceae bacterium]
MNLAIVIPALNEAAMISAVVAAVVPFGRVIVVDDGSTDDTGLLAAKAGAEVVRNEGPHGYDAALARGYAKAAEIGCDTIATIDGDGQIGAEALSQAIEKKRDDSVEIVIGVRDHQARWSERLFSCYVRLRYAVPDILCGLKIFPIELYLAHKSLAETESVNTALALVALRNGARVALSPVQVRAREDSSRFGSFLRANFKILRVFVSVIVADLFHSKR